MTQHTPTPWRVGTKHPSRIIGPQALVANTCDPQDDGSPNATEVANAAFIVRACNAHEDLVAAIKLVRQTLAREDMPGDVYDRISSIIEEPTRAALAKAKGKL